MRAGMTINRVDPEGLGLKRAGSFWGVLDRLLDEEHITFDPVSGASAGMP